MNPTSVDESRSNVRRLLNMTRRNRPKAQHGGARDGAGRKSVFGVKAVDKPFAMDFTEKGRKALASLTRRTKLSRNAVVGVLALAHADTLTFTDDDVFPDKAQEVLSIRVPPKAAAKLRAARARTDRSYSDIGEALVLRYGARTKFPDAAQTS
jgi:hypothetical protein